MPFSTEFPADSLSAQIANRRLPVRKRRRAEMDVLAPETVDAIANAVIDQEVTLGFSHGAVETMYIS